MMIILLARARELTAMIRNIPLMTMRRKSFLGSSPNVYPLLPLRLKHWWLTAVQLPELSQLLWNSVTININVGSFKEETKI